MICSLIRSSHQLNYLELHGTIRRRKIRFSSYLSLIQLNLGGHRYLPSLTAYYKYKNGSTRSIVSVLSHKENISRLGIYR